MKSNIRRSTFKNYPNSSNLQRRQALRSNHLYVSNLAKKAASQSR